MILSETLVDTHLYDAGETGNDWHGNGSHSDESLTALPFMELEDSPSLLNSLQLNNSSQSWLSESVFKELTLKSRLPPVVSFFFLFFSITHTIEHIEDRDLRYYKHNS